MRVSGSHFVCEDGTPFFWLADTAWNAALRGDEDEWKEYLDARTEQGFTVIQFVTTQWRGCSQPIHGRPYDESCGRLVLNEAAFLKMDRWIQMINERGMTAAPVMFWANTAQCPGQALSEEACIQLGRHMVHRWRNHDMVWLLAGDGEYTEEQVSGRWKRIGSAVFADYPEAVVTVHPCGLSWVGDILADQAWYSFVGVQSGHGKGERDLDWLLRGPYSTAWARLDRPFVNLEPSYEAMTPYGTQDRFGDYYVRRAAYWSLLLVPPAGVTYGHSSIWMWARKRNEQAEGHPNSWAAQPWREELRTAGTRSMTLLKQFFLQLPWTDLRPAPELLVEQPGSGDLASFVAIAATDTRDWVVAYLPVGGGVRLWGDSLRSDRHHYWVDPRTGEWRHRGVLAVGDERGLTAPDNRDWLLVCAPRELP